MIIRSKTHSYRIGRKVSDTSEYRLFLCIQQGIKRECLLQIASTTKRNGGLDRAAYMLSELKRRADELEIEYAKVKTNPKDFLNYDLGFPELLESFISPEQGGRRINILAFRNVENINQMVPLSNIINKDNQRIDLRTSAWIMGKALKLLTFFHSEFISPIIITGNNLLIEPSQHYVLIFDWSKAQIFADNLGILPYSQRKLDISGLAQTVITALGGNCKTGEFPHEENPAFGSYTKFLWDLAQANISSTDRAHARFYNLIDSLWEYKYYPFTTLPIN